MIMAIIPLLSTKICKFQCQLCYIAYNGFHKSTTNYLNQSWREKKKLTANPNAFGPLTNLPDYSFKDGRPAPLSTGQYRRLRKQRQYMERIRVLVSQVDRAVENHAKAEKEKELERQRILENKLKPKGNLLLKDNHN
ncbi:large ribosomal subunit protein mL52 [Prorops nasuta]|uniref:large ribosomal subunit protein mL52 n=1 Tax=Prorops nasuta TaxID=863751 RepID=UPI0034CFA41D